MLFVNEIGEIVHGVVDQYSGSANKNIGDAFLLVWKFLDEDVEYNEETDEVSLVHSEENPNYRI
jgi:class 3 adenylate cyclase